MGPFGSSKHFHVLARNSLYVILKARLFCRYLRGSSLRIIYVFEDKSQTVEFIEIYFKGDRVNENRERIKKYLEK